MYSTAKSYDMNFLATELVCIDTKQEEQVNITNSRAMPEPTAERKGKPVTAASLQIL